MKIDFFTPTASDGSVKYRFCTDDGENVEALAFLYNGGLRVLCLSTQIGCDMGCKFCATAQIPRKRNLTREEIVDQAQLILTHSFGGSYPDTITLAGMGEPLANYEASLGALEEFRRLYGDIRLSLSTVGLTGQIRRMIKERRNVGLYLSLHATDPNVRREIMPLAKVHDLQELIPLVKEYASINKPGSVRISYLLLDQITDSKEQLGELIRLLDDHRAKDIIVQLRIWNPVDGLKFKSSSQPVVDFWVNELNRHGIQTCIRPSVGGEVHGACGQMANRKPQHRIIPLYFFQDALEYMQDVDEKSLLIFDVDATLTLPQEAILHPVHFEKYKDYVAALHQSIGKDKKHFLNHQIIAHPVALVEHSAAEFIRYFQDKKVPCVAFTNAKSGRFSKADIRFSDVRFSQLQSVGIDFSKSTLQDRVWNYLNPTFGDFPSLERGIIYSCGKDNEKGSVLKEFLKANPSFEKIIFFDDKKKHLDSVAEVIKRDFPALTFTGFHYKGADRTLPSREVLLQEFSNYIEKLLHRIDCT